MKPLNLASSLAIVSFAMVSTAQAQTPDTTTPDASAEPQEIIVTATKRSERLIEVPLSISVVDASTMDSHNLVSVQDIVSRVPGLAANQVGSGRVQIAIHGPNPSGMNNTTAAHTHKDFPTP